MVTDLQEEETAESLECGDLGLDRGLTFRPASPPPPATSKLEEAGQVTGLLHQLSIAREEQDR